MTTSITRPTPGWVKYACLAKPKAPITKIGILSLVTLNLEIETCLTCFQQRYRCLILVWRAHDVLGESKNVSAGLLVNASRLGDGHVCLNNPQSAPAYRGRIQRI